MGYIILYLEATLIVLIILFLISCIYLFKTKKRMPHYTILCVKNNEECIEGIIYSLINSYKKTYAFNQSHKILILDANSYDNTTEILTKLAKKYDFIEILTEEKYSKLT